SGQYLLQANGLSESDVRVVTALDLTGAFTLETPADVTQETLTAELQQVPGFIFVSDTSDATVPVPSGSPAPMVPGGGFEAIPGPNDSGGQSGDGPPAGVWSPGPILAPTTIGTMMLLSDGRVIAQGGGVTNAWYQLRPDANGSYVNGTWSPIASMGSQRLYFGSNVLPSGKVVVVGGEYSGPAGSGNWANTGEIYDPIANTWTPIAPFPQTQFGDGQTEILPDGRIIAGYLSGPQTYIYDPATNTWTFAANKIRNDRNNEETWVLLPDH